MINKTILIGNVGQNPEVKSFNNGGKIASFSLATTEYWKNKEGNKQSKTQWHKIIVKNIKLIENVIEKQYIQKGTKLYIEGKIEYRDYTDKDNNTQSITEIIVDILQIILDNKKTEDITDKAKENSEDIEDDEIPF